jgi:hypothetical protein
MKRILEISIYRPGDITSEAADLADANAHASETLDVFTGQAMVRSRFRDYDHKDFHQSITGFGETTGALPGDRVKNGAYGRSNETGRE